jgi:glycosyltransferase involved in cell wall biosynthesis
METGKTLFIIWKAYQRRVEAFADSLNINPIYIHFEWEEKSRLHKIFSYLFKLYKTWSIFATTKPGFFYVQAPPTFLIYSSYLYCKLTGAKFAVDAHNTMIGESLWSRMPFVRSILKSSAVVIVHNEDMAKLAKAYGLPHTVLMDRPPHVESTYPYPHEIMGKCHQPKVVVPCSFDIDEPLDEMQKATLLLPDIDFFITWYTEKLPEEYVRGFGANTVFTGFLEKKSFDALLAHADAVLVLTTRDGTQPSGATEALAFQKPLVVSDFKIIRDMFPMGAVYIDNDAPSIANGISSAIQMKENLASDMACFKKEKLRLWDLQCDTLIKFLS